MSDDEKWIKVYRYYDGYIDGVLKNDGYLVYWGLADDSPGVGSDGGERVYEMWPITHEPTDEELAKPFTEVPRLSITPVGTITESQLHEYEVKEGP